MIFGTDDRIKVGEASIKRIHAVSVQIESHYADGSISIGSGTIVGENDVLTAAHVVYDDKLGFAEYTVITPARAGSVKPYGVAYGYEFFVPSGWKSSQDYRLDFAIITMDRAIGRYTGWADFFEVVAFWPASYNGSVSSYGYPSDLYDGKMLIKSEGSAAVLIDGILEYRNLDAEPGQSGSGVFLDDDYTKLMGLISHESYSPDYIGVVPMKSAAISMIESWVHANDEGLPLPLDASDLEKPLVYDISLLYYAFLGRAPDKSGLDYWIQEYKNGMDLKDISVNFYNSQEYSRSVMALYTDEEFVDALYQRTLGRSADAEGKAYWLDDLTHNDRATVAYLFATSSEHKANNALNLYQIWHREYQDFALEAYGGGESDILSASGEGDSMLFGADGDDLLIGEAYDDYLWGGAGNDTITGGMGRDFFAWELGDGYDVCKDFNIYEDYVRLRGEFEWEWKVSNDGWLMLEAKDGGGLVLSGVLPNESSKISVVQ